MIHDIYGPVPLPVQPPYLLYGTVGLAVLLLFLLFYLWFRKRSASAPPPVPPGTIAREQLDQAREFMNSPQARHYLDRVSEILRGYIESSFLIRSTRLTTREFLADLQYGLPTENDLSAFSAELQECLEICDLAKFAHRPATADSLQAMEAAIIRFVEQTEQQTGLTTVKEGK